MAYIGDRAAICDAFWEPDRHCRLLSDGRSKLTKGRKPSQIKSRGSSSGSFPTPFSDATDCFFTDTNTWAQKDRHRQERSDGRPLSDRKTSRPLRVRERWGGLVCCGHRPFVCMVTP